MEDRLQLLADALEKEAEELTKKAKQKHALAKEAKRKAAATKRAMDKQAEKDLFTVAGRLVITAKHGQAGMRAAIHRQLNAMEPQKERERLLAALERTWPEPAKTSSVEPQKVPATPVAPVSGTGNNSQQAAS